MVFITLQNNQILRTNGVSACETGSATLRLYSMLLRSLLCVLHRHYFLLHRKLEATIETQTEISTNECFLSCSLCTLSPHVSLGVEHQAITQPLFSTYYCFCFTDKDTDPQSKVNIALQPDLNLGRHKCKALLLL